MPADPAADPTTLEELFRSLDLSLTVRPSGDDEGAWACTLVRPDGERFEIESVSFYDVDPDTDEEWEVEPTPSRVLGVLAGGEFEAEDDEGPPPRPRRPRPRGRSWATRRTRCCCVSTRATEA